MTVGSAHAHSSSQAGFGPALIQKASGIKVHLSSIHTAVLFVLHGLGRVGGVHGLGGLGGSGLPGFGGGVDPPGVLGDTHFHFTQYPLCKVYPAPHFGLQLSDTES